MSGHDCGAPGDAAHSCVSQPVPLLTPRPPTLRSELTHVAMGKSKVWRDFYQECVASRFGGTWLAYTNLLGTVNLLPSAGQAVKSVRSITSGPRDTEEYTTNHSKFAVCQDAQRAFFGDLNRYRNRANDNVRAGGGVVVANSTLSAALLKLLSLSGGPDDYVEPKS